MEIRMPNVSFTPPNICRNLTKMQRETFSPAFVVEVDDISSESKFQELDIKFKESYFKPSTSIELGLLIDPINHKIWTYKRDISRKVFRREHGWRDVNGGDTLPGFILVISMIEQTLLVCHYYIIITPFYCFS